jgi:hypothetical protein
VAERAPLEHQLAELAYRQVTYEFARLEGKIKDDDKQRLVALRKKLTEFNNLKPPPLPMGLTVTDVGPMAAPTFIPKKLNQPAIEPGFLTLLDEKPAVIPQTSGRTTGRRTELARWITRPDHPLTTRVIVNRIWQGHFGHGLVATASDYGRLGEKPTHPELLDWLAPRFVQDGWSFKKLHRLILTSQAYRQSATHPANTEALKKDPDNRLLWKTATRRLDAEQIRDTLLWATGELDLTAGGPGVAPTNPRRSIYTTVMRNTHDALLDVFDAPEGFTSTAERNVTTTATQALLMFNSPYMLQRAKALADRVQKGKYSDDRERIDAACRLTFGRLPTEKDRKRMLGFLGGNRDETGQVATAAFRAEKMPYREGRSAVLNPDGPQARLRVPRIAELPEGDFTIEAFVLLRSLYDDASVRTIVSQWNMSKNKPGWSLGVTSRKSAFKPQTLVLQLAGDPEKNGTDYEAVFSGLHIALNKPYFVAVTFHLSDPDKQGITFYAKDLSNDEEPLQSVRSGHKMKGLSKPEAAFVIGGRDMEKVQHNWDGLIDDVRLSRGVLRPEQLLLTAEGVTDKTVAYWQFEQKPGVLKDSSGHGNDIQPASGPGSGTDARTAAWVDLCHVLLNANEFLYVD